MNVGSVERLWTVTETAEYLRLPVSSLYKMTGRVGDLHIPHLKLAGRLRFRKTDIDRWLETLAVSNVELLDKVRRKAQEVADGVNTRKKTA